MSRNIKYQLLTCIDKNFCPGTNKHSLKIAKKMDNTRIFSYSDRKNLINVYSQFASYLKKNFDSVKFVKDIKAEHIQNFLNTKAAEGCSKETLHTYWSNFNKMQNLINSTYHAHVNFSGCFVPAPRSADKIRCHAMSDGDFKKLYQSYGSKSVMRDVLHISYAAGLRADEVVNLQGRDIDIENGVVKVFHGKGGKNRDVPIEDSDKQYFQSLKDRYSDNDRIVGIKKNSIYKSINRHKAMAGISCSYYHTAIHAIRKNYAQRQYDAFRRQGSTQGEALSKVSVILGHGQDRHELDNCIQQYVLNIW